MNDRANDTLHTLVGVTLAWISHITLTEIGQVVVMVCALGNLGMQYLRWKFPRNGS